MSILAAINGSTAKGIVGVMLIKPIVFIQHRYSRRFNGGHITEGIPHNLKMVVHFAAAAHKEALGHIPAAVAAAACKIQLFKKMNTLTLHLPVPYKIKSGSKPGKPRTYYIRRLFINILRLLRMCECFISSCGIIHIFCLPEFFLCFDYTLFSGIYNRHKSPRVKTLDTGAKMQKK